MLRRQPPDGGGERLVLLRVNQVGERIDQRHVVLVPCGARGPGALPPRLVGVNPLRQHRQQLLLVSLGLGLPLGDSVGHAVNERRVVRVPLRSDRAPALVYGMVLRHQRQHGVGKRLHAVVQLVGLIRRRRAPSLLRAPPGEQPVHRLQQHLILIAVRSHPLRAAARLARGLALERTCGEVLHREQQLVLRLAQHPSPVARASQLTLHAVVAALCAHVRLGLPLQEADGRQPRREIRAAALAVRLARSRGPWSQVLGPKPALDELYRRRHLRRHLRRHVLTCGGTRSAVGGRGA